MISGNLFQFGLLKTSAISPDFCAHHLPRPVHENGFETRAIVFDEGRPTHLIVDPALNVNEDCILVVRGAGAVGGGLSWLRDGEVMRLDLNACARDALVEPDAIARRRSGGALPVLDSRTPWEELAREKIGPLVLVARWTSRLNTGALHASCQDTIIEGV